jgi:hypothetical protein
MTIYDKLIKCIHNDDYHKVQQLLKDSNITFYYDTYKYVPLLLATFNKELDLVQPYYEDILWRHSYNYHQSTMELYDISLNGRYYKLFTLLLDNDIVNLKSLNRYFINNNSNYKYYMARLADKNIYIQSYYPYTFYVYNEELLFKINWLKDMIKCNIPISMNYFRLSNKVLMLYVICRYVSYQQLPIPKNLIYQCVIPYMYN